MAVSSQPDMAEIASVFGGSAPHSLSEYYGKASGIPSSGAISLSHFIGKSGVNTVNRTVTEGSVTGKFGNNYGYSANAYGAVNSRAFRGTNIQAIGWGSLVQSFTVVLVGNIPQNYFDRIYLQGVGWLTSASAAYGYLETGNTTSWQWSSQPQGGWDGSGTRSVIFEYA